MTTDVLRASRRRLDAVLVWTLALLAASGATAHAATTVAQLDGLDIVHDGAGNLRVTVGDRTPLAATLLWFDASSSTGRALTQEAGFDTSRRGAEMLARRAGTPATLATQVRHWNYFHLNPVVFLDARWRGDDGLELDGAPGLSLVPEGGLQRREVDVQPHLAVGRAPRTRVEIFETIVDLDGFERRHVGIVRLDRARAARDGEALTWNDADGHWPLALIVARSRSSLDYFVGQALVTYDRAGAAKTPVWNVPPMCGRCRAPEIEELSVEVELRDRSLIVHADAQGSETLHPIAWAALRIEDTPLNLFHRGEDDGQAMFTIPVGSPFALTLAEAIEGGKVDAEIVMDAGTIVRPKGVFVTASPYLVDSVRAAAPTDLSDELPSYLSPRLVTNRPNPFIEATSIEVTVPATLDEAFDLDASMRARIDPVTPPPFGDAPTVRVKVYNVSGQLVNVLDERPRDFGRFTVRWDGTDVQGRPVAAGAYYVNVEIDEWSVTKRVLRIRN